MVHFCEQQPLDPNTSSTAPNLSENLFNLVIVIKNALAINFGTMLEKNDHFSANFANVLNEISLVFSKAKLPCESFEDFLQVIHFCMMKLLKTGVRNFEIAVKAFKLFLLSFLTKMKSSGLAEVERFIKMKQISEINIAGQRSLFAPPVLLQLIPALRVHNITEKCNHKMPKKSIKNK